MFLLFRPSRTLGFGNVDNQLWQMISLSLIKQRPPVPWQILERELRRFRVLALRLYVAGPQDQGYRKVAW